MTEITNELIQKAITGNQDAITTLYESTYSVVYKTVRALIRDEDTALDIVQDSYIKGFQSLEQLDTPEHYQAWMKRIAINKAKDYLKKKSPVLFSALSDDENEEVEFINDRLDHCPDQVLDQKETTRLMNEILNTLSDEQRIVIGMFYYEELSVREISEVLGCTENTVKSRLNYGRKKIEVKVRELEKKGTKLYSLAPLPFLLWLFRQDAQAAEMPSIEIRNAITQSFSSSAGKLEHVVKKMPKSETSGSSAVKSAGTAAKSTGTAAKSAGTAAKIAAGTASKGIGTKVVTGIVIASVLGGGAAGISVYQSKSNTTVREAVSEEEAFEEAVLAEAVLQEAILEESELEEAVLEEAIPEEVVLEEAIPEETEEDPTEEEDEADLTEDLSPLTNDHSIFDDIIADFQRRFQNQEGPADGRGNAYGFYDLNSDGQDELLIADTYYDGYDEGLHVANVCGIYTVIQDEPVQIAEGWSRNLYTIYEDGYIRNTGSVDNDTLIDLVYILSADGSLEEVDVDPDTLKDLQEIPYTVLEEEMSEENSEETDSEDLTVKSFEQILERLEEASLVPVSDFEADPGYYSYIYRDLGVGIINQLLYRDDGVHTLDFFCREYDIDNDGEDELLFGRSASPSWVTPIAIYKIGEQAIVGQGLMDYEFPNDADSEYPQWNLAF